MNTYKGKNAVDRHVARARIERAFQTHYLPANSKQTACGISAFLCAKVSGEADTDANERINVTIDSECVTCRVCEKAMP